MARGWFDAFRENGGPTWYGENRTPTSADLISVSIITVFLIFLVAFLVIFPGIRKERWSSFFAVLVSLFVGAVILLCIHHPAWHCGEVRIVAPYRSFSSERLDAMLGVNFGLTFVNITLRGTPENNLHDHMNYNERFLFAEVRSMQKELDHALDKGLPYPILSVIEYLSVDRAGFIWGRSYRLAGYYTHILLWFAFAVWLLMLLMLCLVPQCFSRVLMSLGGILWLSNTVYALAVPRNFVVPFPSTDDSTIVLNCQHCWSFWVTVGTGALCVIMGGLIRILELFRTDYTFVTFLQVGFDEADLTQCRQCSKQSACVGNHSNELQLAGGGNESHGASQISVSSFASNKQGDVEAGGSDIPLRTLRRSFEIPELEEVMDFGSVTPTTKEAPRVIRRTPSLLSPSGKAIPSDKLLKPCRLSANSSLAAGPSHGHHKWSQDTVFSLNDFLESKAISERPAVKRRFSVASSDYSNNPYVNNYTAPPVVTPRKRNVSKTKLSSASFNAAGSFAAAAAKKFPLSSRSFLDRRGRPSFKFSLPSDSPPKLHPGQQSQQQQREVSRDKLANFLRARKHKVSSSSANQISHVTGELPNGRRPPKICVTRNSSMPYGSVRPAVHLHDHLEEVCVEPTPLGESDSSTSPGPSSSSAGGAAGRIDFFVPRQESAEFVSQRVAADDSSPPVNPSPRRKSNDWMLRSGSYQRRDVIDE